MAKSISEVQTYRNLIKAYKELLKQEVDPSKQKALKNWIEMRENAIKAHKFSRLRTKTS